MNSKLILDHVYGHEKSLANRVYMTQPIGQGQVIDYTWQDATSTAAQFELSTQIEVGVGVTKAKRYKFYVSAAKQQGWTNLFNNPASAFDFKSTGIIVSTGMKFEFGKGLLR